MAIVKRYAHINHVANATQDLLDAASAKISGSMLVGTDVFGSKLELTGSLYVSRNAVIKEHLTGTLGALFLDTIKVNQQADMVDVFPQVTDTSDLGSQAYRWDNLFAKRVEAETLSSSVDADFNGTLHVFGDSTFQAGDVFVTVGKIEATAGDIIALAGTVSASVALKTDGTLGVHGISTLHGAVIADSTLDVAGDFKVNTDQFIVYGANGNTTINGNLTVNGDVLVDGETFTLDSVHLLVEDKNIILANFTGSGGPSDAHADGGGITISSSVGNKELLWDLSTITGMAPSFTVNQDWSPSAHLGNSLGQNAQRWQTVYAADGAFTNVTASGDLRGQTLHVIGQSTLAAIDAVSLSASANVRALTLNVVSTAAFGGLATFNAGGTVPSGQTFTIAGGATLEVAGTANYVNISASGNISAAGALTGSALRIHGVDLSPISASLTTNASTGSLFSFAIADGQVMKLELEVIAAGIAEGHEGHVAIAGFKYSIICAADPVNGLSTSAIELAKEVMGEGPLLDIALNDSDVPNVLRVIADGSLCAYDAHWSVQVVKKMVLDAATGAVIY